MRTCGGCGGLLGRDCWNEQECVWIAQDMARHAASPQRPEPCQGCSMITGNLVDCFGLCAGATCQEDIDARAALYLAIPTTFGGKR